MPDIDNGVRVDRVITYRHVFLHAAPGAMVPVIVNMARPAPTNLAEIEGLTQSVAGDLSRMTQQTVPSESLVYVSTTALPNQPWQEPKQVPPSLFVPDGHGNLVVPGRG